MHEKSADEKRPGWDEYFMNIANMISKRATCPRKRLGAIIVKDKRIIATGYNGSPPGMKHCDDIGCFIVPTVKIISGKNVTKDHCIRTLHAEQNAIVQCAVHGASPKGATMYSTINPCYLCAKMIVAVGIKKFVYTGEYHHDDGMDVKALELLREAGMEVIKFDNEK